MKRVTQKDKILKYAVTFPKAKAAQIAKHANCSVAAVYTTLSAWRKRNKDVKVVTRLDEVTNLTPTKMAKLTHAVTKGRGQPSAESRVTKLFMNAQQMKAMQMVTSNTSINDAVNHPAHYKVGGIETIDFIEAKKLGYNLGNVIKYVTRADHKGLRKQDLEKAMWYLKREIDRT